VSGFRQPRERVYVAEFFGGPMDGHRMSVVMPAANIVFVIGGRTWDYRLAAADGRLRYEFTGSSGRECRETM